MAGGRGIVIQISGDGEGAKAALQLVREQLAETAAKAHESGSEIGESMERVKNALETVGLYMGIREAIDAMKELVFGSLELGESLEKASQKTGLAVETLSTLHYAAAVTGTDFDGLTSAVAKMGITIASASDGNKKAQSILKSLGLDAKDLAGRTDGAEIAFKKLSETIAATDSSSRRLDLARNVFGKAGAEMLPLLIDVGSHFDEFKAKAQAAGVYLTTDGAKALEETNEKLHDMEQRAKGAGIAFTEGLSPALGKMFDVIAGGRNTSEVFNQLGEATARILAEIAAAAYVAAAGALTLQAAYDLVIDPKRGMKDLADAKELMAQAAKFQDIATAPRSTQPEIASNTERHKGAGGFEGVGDLSDKKVKSDDGFLKGYEELAQERAKVEADAQKQASQAMLAELESQHKQMLVSDADFLAEKLRLQVEGFEAEKAGLEKQLADLQSLAMHQHDDPTLKKDSAGNSVEELKTQKDILDVQQKIGEVVAKSQVAGSANTAEAFAAGRAQELKSLELAAKLEEERVSGLNQQIALIQKRNDLEAEKVRQGGGSDADVANVRALGAIEQAKLRIADVNRRIEDSEQDNKLAVEALNDAIAKDPRLKRADTLQINALNKAEAQSLRDLVAEYDALAAELGGPYLQKSKDLHAQLDTMNRPTNREPSQMAKEVASSVESMAERLATATQSGKDSFHKMAMSIEQDVLRLAVKIAAQKWLTPLLTGLGGGGGGASAPIATSDSGGLPTFAGGGDFSGGPMIVGEEGPELLTPSGPGNITPNSVLSSLADRGGGGSAPNVAFNVTNASSQPVTARQTSSSFDSDSRQFITHVILEDQASGGPISQGMRGLSS